ncbi:hypothetical protein TP49_23345, partial (plasmid) [Xanthomonas citri pv. aurantifolii]
MLKANESYSLSFQTSMNILNQPPYCGSGGFVIKHAHWIEILKRRLEPIFCYLLDGKMILI